MGSPAKAFPRHGGHRGSMRAGNAKAHLHLPMIILLLLLATAGQAWPQQQVDAAKLAGLTKLAGVLGEGVVGENEVVKARQSEGGWGQKGKAGSGWGLKEGLLAGNLPSPQVFGNPQQDRGRVAKFQQAAIGGSTFGSASDQSRDFKLLSAFEQFVEGGRGKSGGRTESKTGSRIGREQEKQRQNNENWPEIENKRKGREEGRRRADGRKYVETNLDGSSVDFTEGDQRQRKVSVGEKEELNAEEEMLRRMVGSIQKSITQEDSNRLQNSSAINSSSTAQSAITSLGENPVAFVGRNVVPEAGTAFSVKGKEEGGEIKDKNRSTEFPQTEMSLSEGGDVGGEERTTKGGKAGNDLNGVPTEGSHQEDEELEQPMALKKRSEEDSIHSMPTSSWVLATALALALVCILAILGLGCHLHGTRSCPAPGSKSPFSDLSPTFQSAKLAFSKTPPEERPGSKDSPINGTMINDSTTTGSRAHKFAEWEERNRPAGSVAVTEHLVDVAGEEEDNDMVYECPGLAPHGEMVVTNPFFMSQELSVERGKITKAPCPVNVNNNMRHGSINRNLR